MQTQYYESTISVSVKQIPIVDTKHRPNTLWMLSNDTTTMVNDFQIYTSAEDVARHYLSTSNTYKLANIYFNNAGGNASSADGALMITKLTSTVGATAGYFTTVNISANVDNFKTITDGRIGYTLDGGVTVINVEGLNFKKSQVQSLADIAEVIDRKINEASIISDGTVIKGINKNFGADSSFAFVAPTAGTGIDISGATFLNIATGTAVAGTNGTYDVNEILVKLKAQESATILPLLTTSFMLKEEDINTIVDYVKNDLTFKLTLFLQGVEAGSPIYQNILKPKLSSHANNLHLTASLYKPTDNTGFDSLVYNMKLCAIAHSSNPFNPSVVSELIQINNKGNIDYEQEIKVMDFDTFNDATKKATLLGMEQDGCIIYRPIDAYNYDIKSSTRIINGNKIEFSNQLAIAQQIGYIRFVILDFLRNNNFLDNEATAFDIITELRSRVFNILSQPDRKFITPYKQYTGQVSIAIGDAKKQTEKEQMQNVGYYITSEINDNGSIKNIKFIQHTPLGLNKVNIIGINMV